MSQFSIDSVPSNIKWATFGVVPGALVAVGVKGSHLMNGPGGGKPLVLGGKAAALAASLAFDAETIRSMPLPKDRHSAAVVGAVTGAAMAGGTVASAAWLIGPTHLSDGALRHVGWAGFKGAAVGLAAGAIAGAVFAGKGGTE